MISAYYGFVDAFSCFQVVQKAAKYGGSWEMEASPCHVGACLITVVYMKYTLVTFILNCSECCIKAVLLACVVAERSCLVFQG